MDFSSLEESFKNKIHSSVYSIERKMKFYLEEEQLYKIEIRQPENNPLVVVRPDKIKAKANYIGRDRPKDCDYILIDIKYKAIFLIELKGGNKTCGRQEVSKQLIAGKKWLEHIFFLIGMKYEDVKNFKIFLLNLCYKGRQDRNWKANVNSKTNYVIKLNGPKLQLGSFYHMNDYKITIDNFYKKINLNF
ncbi:hypothetical protein Si131_00313 [Streptococcus infantarius subsp. infantarius]|nr:hypothetical protein [Streptococcus infantarius subsp. infantarius]